MKYKNKKMKQGKVTQITKTAGGYYGGMSEAGAKAEYNRLKDHMAKFHVKSNIPQFSDAKWKAHNDKRTSCWCHGETHLHRTARGQFRVCTATHSKGIHGQWIEIERPEQEEE